MLSSGEKELIEILGRIEANTFGSVGVFVESKCKTSWITNLDPTLFL